MNIVEAMKEAVKTGALIFREREGGCVKIEPTDTSDCCICHISTREIPCRRWQPKAEDLTADDWMVTGS